MVMVRWVDVLLLLFTSAAGQPAPAKLETVSYADLGKLVRAQKGKVVVVYFWAHY